MVTNDSERTGRFPPADHSAECLRKEYIEASPKVNARFNGLVSFNGRVEPGSILEQATLGFFQYQSSDSFFTGGLSIHATPCMAFSCLLNGSMGCTRSFQDPVLCKNATVDWCYADVTGAVASGVFNFVTAFPVFINRQTPSSLLYALGPKAPTLSLTVLHH